MLYHNVVVLAYTWCIDWYGKIQDQEFLLSKKNPFSTIDSYPFLEIVVLSIMSVQFPTH